MLCSFSLSPLKPFVTYWGDTGMETQVFDLHISAQSRVYSPVFAILPVIVSASCSFCFLQPWNLPTGWNHGDLFSLLKHLSVTLKLGCKSATWQVHDGTKWVFLLRRMWVQWLLEHSQEKQERKYLHVWDKTSSLRIKVNTLLAGNGYELEPKGLYPPFWVGG